MKNIILIFISVIFLIGCETDEEKGNKIFTQNAGGINKILNEGLNKNNIDEIITLKERVKEITIKYPNINLSVGLLSGNVKIGDYTISGIEKLIYKFLIKPEWTRQLGTSSDDGGEGVTVDSSDNIYVTGWTYGGLDGNTNSGDYDLFLVKYNSDGVKQ